MMETKLATRKSFPVTVVQVTLQNIEEVAEWCKGTIEQVPTRMLGTMTDLPVIRIKGMGEHKNKVFSASLGCWIVELNGSFRSYKPVQFEASFNLLNVPQPDVEVVVNEADEQIAEDSGVYNSGFRLVENT